jgi:hypothetical protein
MLAALIEALITARADTSPPTPRRPFPTTGPAIEPDAQRTD